VNRPAPWDRAVMQLQRRPTFPLSIPFVPFPYFVRRIARNASASRSHHAALAFFERPKG